MYAIFLSCAAAQPQAAADAREATRFPSPTKPARPAIDTASGYEFAKRPPSLALPQAMIPTATRAMAAATQVPAFNQPRS